MGLRRYSRAALPSPFLYDIPAQTVSGALFWADTVFLRDGASPQYADVWGEAIEPIAALKLAALYELFALPDCAAELLVAHRARIGEYVAVEPLLDLLTPPLGDERLSYRDYIHTFQSNPERFFPRSTIVKKDDASLLGRIRRATGL
jgi:hypothetical protein